MQNWIKVPPSQSMQHASGQAILSIARPEFGRRFFEFMHQEFGATQAIVFSRDNAADKVTTLLAENEISTKEPNELASRYTTRYWPRDPNINFLSSSQDRKILVKMLDHASLHGTEYWYNLFERPALIDKMSVIISGPKLPLYVNLYRSRIRGKFDSCDRDRLLKAQDTVAAILEKHFELIDGQECSEQMLTKAFLSPSLAATAKLSLREAQICARIVLGATVEDIAEELNLSLNSVTTYRKRAFSKIGISTHKQLFAHVLARRRWLNA
jgi:DNA-binding CsgD family transcriptional regulator